MLSCDANSAYKLRDADHLVTFDAFDLLMVEQPLWHDDFYYHSMLQKRMNTPICLDESIRNRRDALAAIEMESCKIINIKLGRVGGFSEAIAVHNAAQERGIPVWCGGMLESGVGRAHNIALSTLENFRLPGDVSASARYWHEDIIEPEVTVTPEGEILDLRCARARLRGAHRPGGAAYGSQRRDSYLRTGGTGVETNRDTYEPNHRGRSVAGVATRRPRIASGRLLGACLSPRAYVFLPHDER